jgi:hypothetical protein
VPRKKSPAQLDREIAAALAKSKQRSRGPEDFKVGDVVQFRWEPDTAGVIRRFDPKVEGQIWVAVATPRGERKIPTDALALVHEKHEDRVRRSVKGHATIKADRGESFASVHRKASREADRTLLNRALNEIYEALYVVAAGPKIYMYGSKDDAQEFMRGLPRYAEGKKIEIRSITAKEQQDLARHKRQAYRNP